MTHATGTTVEVAIERALAAYDALVEVGEEIDDELSYIQDLSEAWRERLTAVSAARGAEPLDPDIDAAVDAAIDEAARITDPHRAIDWLSTFPQVALVTLGETP